MCSILISVLSEMDMKHREIVAIEKQFEQNTRQVYSVFFARTVWLH